MNPREQANLTAEFLEDAVCADCEGREVFIERALARIRTDGASQYYNAERDQMLFESLTVDALFGFIEEELLDAACYLWMIEGRGGPSLEGLVQDVFDMWDSLRNARERG